jgi:hypothetical protein
MPVPVALSELGRGPTQWASEDFNSVFPNSCLWLQTSRGLSRSDQVSGKLHMEDGRWANPARPRS